MQLLELLIKDEIMEQANYYYRRPLYHSLLLLIFLLSIFNASAQLPNGTVVIKDLSELKTFRNKDSTSVDTIQGSLSYKTVMYSWHGPAKEEATITGMTARKFIKRVFCMDNKGHWVLCSEQLIAIEIKPYPQWNWESFDWRNQWYKFTK